jgi:hypothetical protein
MALDIFNKNLKIGPPQPELLKAWQAHYSWRTAPPEILAAPAKRAPEPPAPAPAPGQMWRLEKQLDGPDEDGCRLNMPTVLIISASRAKLEVMQTAPFVELMRIGDIYLGDDEGFVEPWNRFTLPPGVLSEYRGAVAPGLLDRIRAADPARPRSSGLDWEEAFLDLEIRVAEAARQRAAVWQCAPVSWRERIETGWRALKERAMELIPPTADFGGLLTAASEESVEVVFQTPAGLKTGVAQITGVIEEEGWVALKGRLSAPDNISMDAFFAEVKIEGGKAAPPEEVIFEAPFFELGFSSVEPFSPTRLRLLVISYDGG